MAADVSSTIDATEFGRRIAFEDLPTAGAFTVFDASRDMFEVARGFAHFFAHESCGFCTPCRVGTKRLLEILERSTADVVYGDWDFIDRDGQHLRHVRTTSWSRFSPSGVSS